MNHRCVNAPPAPSPPPPLPPQPGGRSEPRRLRAAVVLAGGPGPDGLGGMVDGLVARGVQVAVCATEPAADRHGLWKSGAALVPSPSRWFSVPGAVRPLCSGADVVHAHGVTAGLAVAAARRLAVPGTRGRRRPALVLELDDGPDLRLHRPLARRAVRGADVVLAATPGAVARARRLGAADARLAPAADGEDRGIDDAVAHVLAVYDELAAFPVARGAGIGRP